MSGKFGGVFAGFFYIVFGLVWISMTASMPVGPGPILSVVGLLVIAFGLYVIVKTIRSKGFRPTESQVPEFRIPDGAEPDTSWCLCDGTTTNGLPVPDLRGRMIMGASDAYAAGSTGGTATHTHALSGSVGATTLSGAQLASHTHPAAASYLIYASGDVPVAGGNYRHTASAAPAAGGSQSHTHTISGSSGQASTLPPYYALAYIMRVA